LTENIGIASVISGFCAGLLAAALLTGPYLRRRASFSVADLLGAFFPNPLTRISIAAIAAVCGVLVVLTGYESALRGFSVATGASRSIGAITLGLLLVLLIVPGGLSGVIWLAGGGVVVTITALGLPLALSALHESPLSDAGLARFAGITGTPANLPFEPAVVFALALGLAALGPLLGPAVASRDRSSAWRSGPFALVFVAVIGVLMVLTLSQATTALDAAVVGHSPTEMPPRILASNAQGGISLCGTHTNLATVIEQACARSPGFKDTLRLEDVSAHTTFLFENLPTLRQAGQTLASLAGIFAVVLGVGVAAAGVQSFATSLGHDVFYASRRRFGPATRRLAYARALSIALIALCGGYVARSAVDPRVFITLALAISGALVAPLLYLTLVKRATSRNALAALAVSALVLGQFLLTHRHELPALDLAKTVIFAAIDGVLVGIITSFLFGRKAPVTRPAPPAADDPLGPD
jgi:cation/acetate symporter